MFLLYVFVNVFDFVMKILIITHDSYPRFTSSEERRYVFGRV